MLRFLVHFFAVIGFLVAVSSAWLATVVFQGAKKEIEPEKVILTLDFTRPVVERNIPLPFAIGIDGEPLVLFDVLSAIHNAAEDPRVKGIAATFGSEQMALAHAQEIASAIAAFKKKGKFTYAYGTDFGGFGFGSKAYYLASAFQSVWLQPEGTIGLTGVSVEMPFAKTALDKIGVTADFMQREEYKSFMEFAQRDGFSAPVKAEMQGVVDNISTQIAGGISANRKWDIDRVKDLMARGPFTDLEAAQQGLITRQAYSDEFEAELVRKAGADAEKIDCERYLGFVDEKLPAGEQAYVALIHADGVIMEKAFDGADLFGERVVGADVIAQAFDDAVKDDDIRAIIFRIDSPGGAPAASETIRHAVVHAQAKGKPVIVSMGATAASGGYWIAMNGARIIANPATLTGSIGVLSGKFTVSGLMHKLGISSDRVSSSDNAGMWNPMAPFSSAQRARVNTLLDSIYSSFVKKVGEARKIPSEKMADIAKGHVYTGEQALKIGLVDELGGYYEAMKAVRKELQLDPGAELILEAYPVPPTPLERMIKIFRRLGAESAAAFSVAQTAVSLRAAVGPWVDFAVVDRPVMARMKPMGSVQ